MSTKSLFLLLAPMLACTGTCEGRTVPIRALAYAVTECRATLDNLFIRQALRVQQRDRDPVTVMEASVELSSHEPAPLGDLVEMARAVCREAGLLSFGRGAMIIGIVQRIGALPDASGFVFEVNNDANLLTRRFPLPETGIYFVRPDGTRLRRLGAPSGDAAYDLADPFGNIFRTDRFAVSPDGRTIAFTDGVGSGAEDPLQIVALDVRTGRRTQVTHLPKATLSPGERLIEAMIFVGRRMISFATRADPFNQNPEHETIFLRATLDGRLRPGRALREPGAPTDTGHDPGALVISGGARGIISLELLNRTPVNPRASSPTVMEVFLFQRRPQNFLQLTSFGRVDTVGEVVDVNRRRAFFTASADPLGANTAGTCQLFSIDLLGRRASLRQVTKFNEPNRSRNGCLPPDFSDLSLGSPAGCVVSEVQQDPVMRTLVFRSSCDPFGANPYGDQLFAIGPDGTGLRQLTAAGGYVDSGASTSAELVGTFGYPHVGPP